MQEKVEMNVSEGLVRLSVGIEHIDDLIDDVSQAFKS
jgi:O-succinylhomoserine sulfhydrylase